MAYARIELREGAQIRLRRSSVDRSHSDRSFPVQNVDHDMPVGAPKGDIGRSASNRQTAQHDFIEKLREGGRGERLDGLGGVE